MRIGAQVPTDGHGVEGLRRAWAATCARGDLHAGAVAAAGDDLLARYQEPHRRYHGLAHVDVVLGIVSWLCEPAVPPVAVELSVWFHDAVYDTTRPGSEARSADLARATLRSLGGSPALTDEVAALVVMTADHVPRTDHERLLADADLWILGAPDDLYDRYVEGVRSEYAHVPEDAWRAGRRRVLESFLARDRLFHHPRLAAAEEQMRRNVGRELRSLTAA